VRSLTSATVAFLLAALAIASPAAAADIDLPRPGAGPAQELEVVCNRAVGATPDRCKKSSVPGPVVNDEVVLVGLTGDGAPTTVQLEQRLLLTEVGDYVIRERGPARSAVPLVSGSDPPNTKFGAVVWQGFTPGNRRLGARLALDAGLEALRLPLAVSATFTPAEGGAAQPLEPGGRVPSAGTVRLLIDNRTSQAAVLPTGADADPVALAGALDAARTAAAAAPGLRLPSTETVLPKQLAVTAPARREGTASVPLRVTGFVRLSATTGTVAGPGTTAVPDGAVLAGTLPGGGTAEFTAVVQAAGRVDLDLNVVPALDARLLAPPRGLATWSAWARSRPPLGERTAALDLLVATAATGARASSYSPYLGADLPGTGSTVFRYSFAPPEKVATARAALQPKGGPIALAGVALLLLLVNAGLIWQRS
jgi:hypothetical protein